MPLDLPTDALCPVYDCLTAKELARLASASKAAGVQVSQLDRITVPDCWLDICAILPHLRALTVTPGTSDQHGGSLHIAYRQGIRGVPTRDAYSASKPRPSVDLSKLRSVLPNAQGLTSLDLTGCNMGRESLEDLQELVNLQVLLLTSTLPRLRQPRLRVHWATGGLCL